MLIAGDEAFTGFPASFAWFGQHYLGGYVPVEFLIYIIATVIFGVLLHRTTFGRKVFALGTNPAAAVYSGVPHTRFPRHAFCNDPDSCAGLPRSS